MELNDEHNPFFYAQRTIKLMHHEHGIEMQIDAYRDFWYFHYLLITFPFRIEND